MCARVGEMARRRGKGESEAARERMRSCDGGMGERRRERDRRAGFCERRVRGCRGGEAARGEERARALLRPRGG